MTETEWDNSKDLKAMLDYLPGRASDRKLRHFGIACCRRIWHLLDERGRELVSAAGRYADGLLDEDSLGAVREKGTREFGDVIIASPAAAGCAYSAALAVVFEVPVWNDRAAVQAAWKVAWCAAEAASRSFPDWSVASEEAEQLGLLRDIVENPYRPGWTDPVWLSPAIQELSRSIYDDEAFNRLPLLADALEAAGCDNLGLVAHCRSPAPHVRGCWAVDLVLCME